MNATDYEERAAIREYDGGETRSDAEQSAAAELGRKILRPHQLSAIDMLRASIRSGHRHPLIQAPTGFGKTLLASHIVSGALRKGNRAIITVPSISLIDQTYEAFAAEGIHQIGILQANHPYTDKTAPVQIASLDTLRRREIPEAAIVLVDEAHRRSEFLSKWMHSDDWSKIPFVGLSATPWTKGLGKDFDDLIIASTTQQLIDAGYLSPFRVFGTKIKPDLSGVRTLAGDYKEDDLSDAMGEQHLVADAVQTWLEKGEQLPTFVFAVDRAHARKLQDKFLAAGVPTEYIDAFTKRGERNAIRDKFHSGEIKVVCNVGCLTTGVDWDVRCISLCRPTKSEMLYVQMIGRMLRTAKGKTYAILLDHSMTTLTLGFVTDIHHDNLCDGEKAVSSANKRERKEPLPRECPQCTRIIPPRMVSCVCGFVLRKQSDIEHEDGELHEITSSGGKKSIKKTKYTQEEKQEWFSMLQYYQEDKGYSSGWTSHKYKEKFGVWPRLMKNVSIPPNEIVRNYIRYTAIRCAKGRSKAAA